MKINWSVVGGLGIAVLVFGAPLAYWQFTVKRHNADVAPEPSLNQPQRTQAQDHEEAKKLLTLAEHFVDDPDRAIALLDGSWVLSDGMDKEYLRKYYLVRSRAEAQRQEWGAVRDNLHSYAGIAAYNLETEPWVRLLQAYEERGDPRTERLRALVKILQTDKKEDRPTANDVKAVIEGK